MAPSTIKKAKYILYGVVSTIVIVLFVTYPYKSFNKQLFTSWLQTSHTYFSVGQQEKQKVSCDYYIQQDGTIQAITQQIGIDYFYVQDPKLSNGYLLLAELPQNEYGLICFPEKGPGFLRCTTQDKGGLSLSPWELVGTGDRYLLPTTAAALFGLLYYLYQQYGITLKLGDMSASNGADPWQRGFPHHKGHGHLGNRTGLDVDFQYVNQHGISFFSKNALNDPS